MTRGVAAVHARHAALHQIDALVRVNTFIIATFSRWSRRSATGLPKLEIVLTLP